jgi:predicted amidohydrolase YtcJ
MSAQVDLILKSNAVFTGTGQGTRKAAVAVAGGRIAAVADEREIEALAGRGTKIFPFGDELIMPGFHDFHTHVLLGGLALDTVDLHEATSEEEAADKVRDFAATRPEEPWVLGFGWYHIYWRNKRLPTRKSLDRAVPDRPVFLFNAEYHGAWVNTRALEYCGIDRNTPDPPFGKIERDRQGEPTGFLYETAEVLVGKKALSFSDEYSRKLVSNFMERAARFGITSVNNMLSLPGSELGDTDVYQRMEADGKVTVRFFLEGALQESLDRAEELRRTYTSDKVRFSGLKEFLDGVATTYTAFMVDRYSDKDTRGITLLPPNVAEQRVINADRRGFRVRFHACGDGAVRLALDCYEAARRANGKRDARHCIEHLETVHPRDFERFKDLGVVASIQPEHLAVTEKFQDNPFFERLGTEREPYFWPNKSLSKAGAVVAYGSDFPVVDLNPMLGLYRAVTRLHNDGKPKGGWNPQEKVSVEQALGHYTRDPAYGSFAEDELGTLEAGKHADIVVMDRNLTQCGSDEILNNRTRLTLMGGKVVYED